MFTLLREWNSNAFPHYFNAFSYSKDNISLHIPKFLGKENSPLFHPIQKKKTEMVVSLKRRGVVKYFMDLLQMVTSSAISTHSLAKMLVKKKVLSVFI